MEDNFFSAENEAQSGFFSFKNPGDAIKGTYVGKKSIPAKGIYKDQIAYELMTDNGAVMTVAFNIDKKYTHDAMKFAKIGQFVGFKFEGWFETEASKKDKNISAAKTIKVYLGQMNPNYDPAMGGMTKEVSPEEVSFA